MIKIALENVTLDYPIFNASSISLRHKMVNTVTGGRINKTNQNITFVRALSNVNLEITAGSKVGIIGHNGSGKTTLLRCLSKTYTPTNGKITIDGRLNSFLEIDAGIEPELSGYDNIRRLLMLRSICKKTEIPQLIKEIEEFSELRDFLKLPVRTYSPGMLMRLAFSTITSIVPDIMVMDEFFSVGDGEFREKANNRLKENIKNTPILVFTSHSKELLKNMCNEFYQLTQGRLEKITLDN